MKNLLRMGIAACCLISTCPVSAKNLADPQSGCQLTVPDDWVVNDFKRPSGYAVGSHNPAQTESVSLFVVPMSATGPLNDDSEYVKGFVRSCQDNKSTIAKREHRTVNGTDFYVLTIVQETNPALKMMAWLTVAQGQAYQIGLYTKDTDPLKNADFLAIINSFSILKK